MMSEEVTMANITVRRANVILDISEAQKEEYLAKGFDVLGPDGKVIIKTTPNDINSLKKAYVELSKKVQDLEAENDKLKARLSSKSEKADEAFEEKPRRRKREE